MSTPEISVSRKLNVDDGNGGQTEQTQFVYARLLTPELEVLIRNQNIETRDINSMKWPLFGLSRHAVCKLLMLRTDVLQLVSQTGDIEESASSYSNTNEFRIWFRCTDNPEDEGQIFTRMHIAKVTPLAVTGNGYVKKVPRVDENGDPVVDDSGNQLEDDVHEGEALYIVEFRCNRWWWSSYRRFDFSGFNVDCSSDPRTTPFMSTWVESHNIGPVSPGSGETVNEMLRKFLEGSANLGCGLGRRNLAADNSLPALFRQFAPCNDTFVEYDYRNLRMVSGNMDKHRPLVEVFDEICRESHLAVSYRQSGSINTGIEGSYEFVLVDITRISLGENLKNFLDRHGNNVIAGAIDEQTLEGEFGFPRGDRWSRMINLAPITQACLYSADVGIAHRAVVPDGRPPQVFSYFSAYGENAQLMGAPENSLYYKAWHLPMPFSEFHPYDIVATTFRQLEGMNWGNARPRFINYKKFPSAFIDLTDSTSIRYWQEVNRQDLISNTYRIYKPPGENYEWYDLGNTDSAKEKPLLPVDGSQNFSDEKDLFDFRKRNAPTCDIWLNKWWMPAADEVFNGIAWIELRLQTDEDGFGFPTTRIWSEQEDPLFCSIADEKPLDIRATGLAKAWRDSDGKTRVHVPWPFGIPCLLKIVGVDSQYLPDGQFNSNIKAWQYKAKIVMRGQGGNNSSYPRKYPPKSDGDHLGQLVDFFDDGNQFSYVRAFNLAELANTSGFSAPGYKMPIAQQGFDVLPIGRDRDGNTHEVIVQAMLYCSDNRYQPSTTSPSQRAEAPAAYFCLTNAIDGECPTPLTLDQSLDGGTY